MNEITGAEKFVADTHAIIWHITSNPRLSTEARRRLLLADEGKAIIYLSVMTSIEILYACEKGKLPFDVLKEFHRRVQSEPTESYQIVEMTYDLARMLSEVPRKIVPELSDRIIAATALNLNLPLITKDQQIQQWEGIITIW